MSSNSRSHRCAKNRAESMVLLTDGTPNPLLRSLEAMYPSSSRVRLYHDGKT